MRLRWLYGDRVAWELRMIVVRERRGSGWPHERGSDTTIHACRAVVAARLRWPDREDAMMRRLHVLAQAGELLDDSDTLEMAAAQAGLPVAEIAAYCAEPEVEQALRADMAEARGRGCAAHEPELSLTPRADPRSVAEVLAWAPYPLTTAEIAAVCDRESEDVRADLARTSRSEGGYWAQPFL